VCFLMLRESTYISTLPLADTQSQTSVIYNTCICIDS
jgi:hypothetical protein